MIINNSILNEKINKKLTPKRFNVVVSFLNFIITEDTSGIVLYSDGDIFKPFEYKRDINIKKIKAKTYQDLINIVGKHCDHTKKLVKKCKTEFYDNFETSCEVNVEREIFELNLENNEVVLTKHVVCIIKELDNIERSFQKDGSTCLVVPISETLNKDSKKQVENWLKYFLCGAK